jgi:hypothetical protein
MTYSQKSTLPPKKQEGKESSINNFGKGLAYFFKGLFFFFVNNILLLLIVGFFAYRTFFVNRLNWALMLFVIALFLIIICRAIAQYRESATATAIYRGLVLLSAGLLITAIFVQTNRFIYVFVPGLSEPTLAKILVRIGITMTTLWVYAIVIAFIYYLYAHEMTKIIWSGRVNRFLDTTFSRKNRHTWQEVNLSNKILLYTIVGGGILSIFTLIVGFVAWLLR